MLAGGFVTGGTPYRYVLNAYGPGSPNGPAFAGQSLVGNAGNNWDYRLQNVYVEPGGPQPPEPLPPQPPTPPQPSGSGPGPVPPPTLPQPPDPALPPGARPEVAPQVPAYIAAPTALFYAGLQNIDELHRRLGEIRDDALAGKDDNVEFFLRGFGNSFNYKTNVPFASDGFNFTGDYSAQQFGANWLYGRNAGGSMRIGLFVTTGQLWYRPVAVDGASKGYVDSTTVSGTVTWQAAAGWYLDTIVSGGTFNGQVSTATMSDVGGLKGNTFLLSVEAGYPMKLGSNGLFVEPEAQFVFQHLGFNRETDVDGIDLDLGGQNQGIFRAGLRLVRPITGPGDMPITPYLKLNLLQGIGGNGKVHLSNVGFDTGAFGTQLDFGGGVTGAITRNLFIYSDVANEQDIGGSGFRGWAFNGGLRYQFGAP